MSYTTLQIGKSNQASFINTILPYISFLYLILLLIPLYRFTRNYQYAAALRKSDTQKAAANWRVYVQRISAQLDIRKKIRVFVSEFVQSPVTVGFLKPVILLPVAILSNLSVQQVEALLLHELAHIRRNDYILNIMVQLIQTTLYFNPFVKAFVREIETEREKSCDDLVMQYQYDVTGYASALLCLQKATTPVFFMPASGKKTSFAVRINYLLGKENKRGKPTGITIISVLVLCIILLSGLFYPPVKSNYDDFTSGITTSSLSASPFYSNVTQQPNSNREPVLTAKENSGVVPNERNKKVVKTKQILEQSETEDIKNNSNNSLKFVRFAEIPVAVLEPEQDEHVKLAISASKQIAGELQWKVIENNLAEVYTAAEKSEIHKMYRESVKRKDWSPLENRLKAIYNEIDWPTVNVRLVTALKQMQTDSLRHVYADAVIKLDEITSVLKENQITGIPDTDITLQSIAEKKAEILQMLETIKPISNGKKTIRL